MSDNSIPLEIDDVFQFSCNCDVPCFNECCHDINQFLTPYDVLRLKNGLNMHSADFLDKYTLTHEGPGTGLPVVTFRTALEAGNACPFVTKEGCSVYNDRPASCRTYPIARAIKRSRETGQISEYFMLMEEDHCRGFAQNKTQSVREWLINQDADGYNTMNDKLIEIISLKNRVIPGPLDQDSAYAFYLACYDTDNFKDDIFNKNILEGTGVTEDRLEKIKTDDVELLNLGMSWIKFKLFGEEFGN